ncbi:hypothetical protein AaE_001339, partial [Aphanomyces astaci]
MDTFYDFDSADDADGLFSDDDDGGVDVIGLLETTRQGTPKQQPQPCKSKGNDDDDHGGVIADLCSDGSWDVRRPELVNVPSLDSTEMATIQPANAFSNVFLDFEVPIQTREIAPGIQTQALTTDTNPVKCDDFGDEFMPLLEEREIPRPIAESSPEKVPRQMPAEDRRASIVLDDNTILLHEATPKHAFIEFICAQPSSHNLQLSLHLPLHPDDQSQVDITYERLHQQTNGLTPSALLDQLKATKLFPYIVSMAQYDVALSRHSTNPILTLRNFQDIVTTWTNSNEPLTIVVPDQSQRLQVLLNGLNHHLDMDVHARCKAEVHEQVWIKAAAKYDHSSSRKKTSKQTQAFVARMQSDLAIRLTKEHAREAQRLHAVQLKETPKPRNPEAPGIISQGSVRILKKNGWIAATADACIERMLLAKAEQQELNELERERRLALDTQTGQRLFRPQVNPSKQQHWRHKRHGGHVCDELYALAQQKALKTAWIQEQSTRAIDATVQTSVQMTAASKQRCEDRFDKDFTAQIASVDISPQELEFPSVTQMEHVLTWFGLLPPGPSFESDVTAVRNDVTDGDFRGWVKSVVLNMPKRSEIWKRCRRHYISRIQPTIAQSYHTKHKPQNPETPKPRTPQRSCHYTLHGKAADAVDLLSDRHNQEEVRVHELRVQLEDSATAECTFSPEIHSKFPQRNDSRDIGHRLYDLAIEQRQKR